MRQLLLSVRERRSLSLILRIYSHVTVALVAAAFIGMLCLVFSEEPMAAVRLAMSVGIPFLAVSVARMMINAPRPYEIYKDIYPEPPKRKCGRSFPSRHAYSAFAISVCVLPVSAVAGTVLLVLSSLMCVCRVLLGIHFVRDVAAGAAIGVISQIIGILIIKPF